MQISFSKVFKNLFLCGNLGSAGQELTKTACAVLGECNMLVLRAPCQEVLSAFGLGFLEVKSLFLTTVSCFM